MWSIIQFWAPYACIFFAVAAITAVVLLLKRRKETFGKDLIPLVSKFDAWGFPIISRLLTAVILDNWLGKDSVTEIMHEIVDMLKRDGLVKLVREVSWKGLKGIFLTNQEDRAEVERLLRETPLPSKVTAPGKPAPDAPLDVV